MLIKVLYPETPYNHTDKQTILNIRSRLLDKAALGGWPDPAYRVDEGIANLSASCKDLEEQYMRVFRNLWKDEELHQT